MLLAEEEPHQIQRWQASFQIRQLRKWMLNPFRRKMPFLVSWALVQALLAHARSLPELQQLDLTVTEGNPMAQALYERCGFSVWGVMPRAVKVDGCLFAKVHMVCPLR